jgi:glycosyltransferase involved in cell wall biosynthesis
MTGILAAAVYPASRASTRLRAEQMAPAFVAVGLQLEVWSLIPERFVNGWFSGSNLRRAAILLASIVRVPALLLKARRAKAVIVLKEVLPLGPPWIERIIAKRRPLIWDVDDSIWVAHPSLFMQRIPEWIRRPARKYEQVCSWARQVWAGSEVLAEWCREHNPDVRVVPTVVEVPLRRPLGGREPIVGWIGSPSTVPFLEAMLPALAPTGSTTRRVLAVGSRVTEVPGIDLDARDWSPEEELTALRRMKVGLYPIDLGHPLAEGKCGLKAILYMSHGIPSVVTPTTTNRFVLRHEVEGLHASTRDEWAGAIDRLLNDDELWERCSRAAHQRAYECFSLQRWGPKIAGYLKELV